MVMMMSVELWGMLIVAAGFGGWVAGNLTGAKRASFHQDSLEDGLANHSAADASGIVWLKAVPKVSTKAQGNAVADSPAAGVSHPSFSACWPQTRRPRSEVFADMPPIEEVREQAQQILETDNVWNACDHSDQIEEDMRTADGRSDTLLNQYRTSIEELRRANARPPSKHGCAPEASTGRAAVTW